MTGHDASVQSWLARSLLPDNLLRLEIAELHLTADITTRIARHDVHSIGDLLALDEEPTWLDATTTALLRTAIARAIDRGLPRHATIAFDPLDWPSLQGHLLIPLDDEQRAMLRAVLGIDEPPRSMVDYSRRIGVDLHATEALAARARARLHESARSLIGHLRDELRDQIKAGNGLLDPSRLPEGTMLAAMAEANDDLWFPLRLAAFCFPHDYHLHHGVLVAVSPSQLRRLVARLRSMLTSDRLPMPLDDLLRDLDANRSHSPRGLVTHLLCHELQLTIETGDDREVVAPNPKSTGSRLAELLTEEGKAMHLHDLVFAYRERYRRATPHRIEQQLRRDSTFVEVGSQTFALRPWHAEDLERATTLSDRAARHICAEGGKQNILDWIADQGCSETSAWLAIDCLRQDPRVRLLGRGEACPATQRRSQVMVQLLTDFGHACGDVVESLFVANQPPEKQRLIRRLLSENRMFVRPEQDRVDTLANFPFDKVRLRRLRKIAERTLTNHNGYAPTALLINELNQTDLGGAWLTPWLLEDILRRQGWFEVLPGGIIALSEHALGSTLLKLARNALRSASVLLTAEEIIRQRPELAEFTASLTDLLRQDPLVQSPDGRRFGLV